MIAYVDPSGTDRKSDFLAVSGYVAPAEKWARFEYEWKQVLTANKLKRFRMAECEFRDAQGCQHKDYRHRPPEHWVTVKIQLAAIIMRHTDSGFGAAIDLKAFQKIVVPRAMALARKYSFFLKMRDPLALGLQIFTAHTLDYVAPVVPKGERLAVVCDNENRGPRGKLMDAYEDVRRIFHWEEHMHAALNFQSSTDFVPLQAADMVSYEVRKTLANRDIREPRKLWTLLADEQETGGRVGLIHYRERELRKVVDDWSRQLVFGWGGRAW